MGPRDDCCEHRDSSPGVKAICGVQLTGSAGVPPALRHPQKEAGETPSLPGRSECEPDPEHLHRIEGKLGIKAALDVVGLTEAVLLAREQEVADGISLAP